MVNLNERDERQKKKNQEEKETKKNRNKKETFTLLYCD